MRETGPAEVPKPRLLDRVRQAIATRHYSRRTEKAYVHWIKRYVFFHDKRHPAEMGAAEVSAFLTSLAVDSKVPEDVPQGGGNAGGGRELADSYAAIYGTVQSDNAVQDTER